MHGKAAAAIEVMLNRFEPWGGVDGMSACRCEESGWHAGRHDLPQDESKCAQARGARELVIPSHSCRAMTCRVPRLHWGQDRLSADFCGSVSSVLASGVVAWRWNLQNAVGTYDLGQGIPRLTRNL